MATLDVQPDPLVAGSNAQLTVSGATGPTLTVTVSDGATPPNTQQVVITIDDDGDGSAAWPVPSDWQVAIFTSPQTEDVTRVVQQPG